MALEMEAINPVRVAWLPANLGILSRWEATRGFCRTRFRRMAWDLIFISWLAAVVCPACGTRNLLPNHPRLRGRGGPLD